MPQRIVNAIRVAANQTGVDFSYLMQKASQESSFDPNAKASTSSATGLYQFTQQTWLQMVKNYGGKYNLGTYADHISMDSSGVAHVTDPSWKQAILNLRKDPTASAEMAGELDKQNQVALKNNVGGKIGGTELYLAHFLGAGGATDFLNEMHDDPKQVAASVLPDAAAANPSVFYAKDGTPRTLQQIYQHFAQKFNGTSGTTMVASAASTHVISSAKSKASYATSGAPITMASAATYYGGAVFGSTATHFSSTGSISGLKIDGSSLYATMMLSQMNQDSAAITSQNAVNLHGKKNPYNLASMAALG
jgi:hypothetical protein